MFLSYSFAGFGRFCYSIWRCYNKVLFVKTGFTQTEYLTYIIYFRVSTWLDIAFHAPTLIGCLFVKDRFRIILLLTCQSLYSSLSS